MTEYPGIWTLLIGAGIGVEKFTLKKLIGVFACLAGVVLTSGVDISGDNDKDRGSFPHKSRRQIGIGDALALSSAVLYGRSPLLASVIVQALALRPTYVSSTALEQLGRLSLLQFRHANAPLLGIYTTLMKKRIGDEARVNMVLFFGFVGLFNLVTLLPGFLIFHYTGFEPFELPPTGRIWSIILVTHRVRLVGYMLTKKDRSTLLRR